jgi:hypothetical protein
MTQFFSLPALSIANGALRIALYGGAAGLQAGAGVPAEALPPGGLQAFTQQVQPELDCGADGDVVDGRE